MPRERRENRKEGTKEDSERRGCVEGKGRRYGNKVLEKKVYDSSF